MLSARRLPLVLLTGFLGSGKTSLLQHALSSPEFPRERTAVVVNDFGKINVDAALLQAKISRLSEMTAGCLCCADYPQLGRDLLALADDPGIDQVWIEASGVAETDDLLDRLTDPRLVKRVGIARTIHVVDASSYPGWWTNRPLAREQLRWADLIVVNQIDRAKPKSLAKIEEDIAAQNPRAVRVDVVRGAVDPVLLALTNTSAARYRVRRSEGQGHRAEPTSALFLPLEKPVSRPALERSLAEAPGTIYRAKGFVAFDDAPAELCVFQKAGEHADVVVWKGARDETGDPLPRGLVLLGRELDAELLATHFSPLGAGLPS
jgi:G3E family GTPase